LTVLVRVATDMPIVPLRQPLTGIG